MPCFVSPINNNENGSEICEGGRCSIKSMEWSPMVGQG